MSAPPLILTTRTNRACPHAPLFHIETVMAGFLQMPKSVAQLTGVLVTAIVTFGTDLELTYSVILGVFAGALATFFVSLSEAKYLDE